MKTLKELKEDIVLAIDLGQKRVVIDYIETIDVSHDEARQTISWIKELTRKYDTVIVLEFENGNQVTFSKGGM